MRYLVTAALLLFAGLCAAYVYGCDGPPTMPDGLALTRTTLRGRVVDQFTKTGVAGVRVTFQGVNATTDAGGRFVVAGVRDGDVLTFRRTGTVTRRTYAWAGDSVWGVVPATFDTAAFRAIARAWTSSGRTVRWVARPTVYIDTRPYGRIDPADLAAWVTETAAAVPGFVSDWAGGTVPVRVVVTSSPPTFPTAGAVGIRFSELASHYGNSAAIGWARVWWDGDYRMVAGDVSLRYREYRNDPTKRRGILGHELGHALGYRHVAVTSLMQPSLGRKDALQPFDRSAARFLYGRVPANRAPDEDSRLRIGLRLAARAGYWEGP